MVLVFSIWVFDPQEFSQEIEQFKHQMGEVGQFSQHGYCPNTRFCPRHNPKTAKPSAKSRFLVQEKEKK